MGVYRENYLAFDLGASSGKLFLGKFDGEKLELDSIYRFANQPVPMGGGLYWDFIGIYAHMRDAIARASSSEGGIASFGIDSYSNDFGFVDSKGLLMAPVRCYRDERTSRCSDAIYKLMPPEMLYMASGNQLAPFNCAMQLAAMRIEGDDLLLEYADKLMMMPDLLGFYLTGNAVSEYTIASVTQLYDFNKKNWSNEILERFRIPRGLLPPVVETGSVLGMVNPRFTEETGAKPFPVVSVCGHDTASAYLAAFQKTPAVIISSGTWAIVGTEVARPVINAYGFRHNIANEGGLPGRHRLLCSLMGNWITQELRRELAFLGEEYSFMELESLAVAQPPMRWTVDVDDSEFFAMGRMREKIVRHCGKYYDSAPESAGEFARCISDSLSLKCVWTMEKLEGLAGCRLPVVAVVGGGSRDAMTCQMIANLSGRPVVSGPSDAAALGNILVQLMAAGRVSSVDQGKDLLRRSFPRQEYEPDGNPFWHEAYELFKQRYKLHT